jgi:hypothetical protein
MSHDVGSKSNENYRKNNDVLLYTVNPNWQLGARA